MAVINLNDCESGVVQVEKVYLEEVFMCQP